MPKPFDFGGVNLTAGGDSSNARPSSETPFCIAMLGDFSARANRKVVDEKTISKRRVVIVDRDNFEEVLSRSGAGIQLPLGQGDSLQLQFSKLRRFPSRPYFPKPRHLWQAPRDARPAGGSPSTFEEAAEEWGFRFPRCKLGVEQARYLAGVRYEPGAFALRQSARRND